MLVRTPRETILSARRIAKWSFRQTHPSASCSPRQAIQRAEFFEGAGADVEHAPNDQHVEFDVGASGGKQRLPELFDLLGGVGTALDVWALLTRHLEREVLVNAADGGVVDGEAVQRTG